MLFLSFFRKIQYGRPGRRVHAAVREASLGAIAALQTIHPRALMILRDHGKVSTKFATCILARKSIKRPPIKTIVSSITMSNTRLVYVPSLLARC